MNAHFQRAILLVQQSRFELAEPELRQVLADSPGLARAHALLGLCYLHREQYREALAEVEQAVHLSPDDARSYYILSVVLSESNRLPEADNAIQEALRLDPVDADAYAQLAEIRHREERWREAAEAAEKGLHIEPDHDRCMNLRAMALVQLGQRSAAGEALRAALQRDPENAFTHANEGWRLMHGGDYDKALEHFREALRIDPELEWARQGIVESLKSRYWIYRIVLNYFLWMMRLDKGTQWGVIIGGYFGYRILRNLARQYPELAPWVLPVLVLYLVFAWMTWVAGPLFNLLLRLNRYGRLVLSREETITSNWIGCCVGGALLFLLVYFAAGPTTALASSLTCAFLIPPTSVIYRCERGWPRKSAAGIALSLAGLGLCSNGLIWISWLFDNGAAGAAHQVGWFLFVLLLLGSLASQFAANALVAASPRR
jgi:tetratricopeptide (TPR) repeat protein